MCNLGLAVSLLTGKWIIAFFFPFSFFSLFDNHGLLLSFFIFSFFDNHGLLLSVRTLITNIACISSTGSQFLDS